MRKTCWRLSDQKSQTVSAPAAAEKARGQRGQCPLSTNKRSYYFNAPGSAKEYSCRCSPAWGGLGRSGGWCGRGLRHERASPQFYESGPARNNPLHIVLDRGGPTHVQLAGQVRAPTHRRRPNPRRR